MSLGSEYRMVSFRSGVSLASGVPSSKQKFRDRSVYVRLQAGQRFICKENYFPFVIFHIPLVIFSRRFSNDR